MADGANWHGTAMSNSRPSSESGVALGLFSKIAAARKEKLSPFVTPPPTTPVSATDKAKERRQSASSGLSQFPEIHDPSGRSHTQSSRGPTGSASAGSRKGSTTRGFVQTLRWTKLEEARVRGQQGGSASPTPLPNPRSGAQKEIAPERTRRSLYEIGRSGTAQDRILPLDDLVTRPATVGDEIVFTPVRGHVRRATETLSVSERRSLANTSESLSLRAPALFLRGQHDSSTFDSPSKPHSDSTIGEVPEQEIYFGEASDSPGVPIVYRSHAAKASNPERMNLDRRNLPVLPLLESEQMLRLLNLQNNSIRKIENLLQLPNLIFLDLYNNRIDKLENLHVVPNLRVLMLGKNRLKKIEGISCLKKLDVLDLHSNDIDKMENLNELTEMRVLNLGSNRITTLEGIDKLHLLTELNLRRNVIVSISQDIGRLPSLQRLFLSNNKLEKLESLDPLLHVASIVELRLDNNGASDHNTSEYRARMIKSFPLLKHLDLKQLTETERKEGLLFYSQARSASKEREQHETMQRAHVVAHIKLLWDKRPRRQAEAASGRDSGGSAAWRRVVRDRPTVAQIVVEEENDAQPTDREDSMVTKAKTGYSEVEVHGDYRVLAIYGDALDALESAKFHASVHAIKFRYVAVDRVAAVASSSTSANLKLFARLRRLNFAHNDIETMDQLDWLAAMGSRSEELFVSGNGVSSRSLFRHYVAARMANVGRLNGREVTATERNAGRQYFHRISRAKPPDGTVAAESIVTKAKEREGRARTPSAAHPGANAATHVLHEIIAAASDIETKSTLVDDAWSTLVSSLVRDALGEISRRDGNYLAACLDGL